MVAERTWESLCWSLAFTYALWWWWWWLVFVVWLTGERRSALFLVGTIVKDPRHLESPTRHEKELNLYTTWVQASLNEVGSSNNHYTTAPDNRKVAPADPNALLFALFFVFMKVLDHSKIM